MTRRYLSRTDTVQEQVVTALRAAGVQVWHSHAIGGGFPDLIACVGGTTLYLLECKSRYGTLTPQQIMFNAHWPVHVVKTPEDALVAVGLLKEQKP